MFENIKEIRMYLVTNMDNTVTSLAEEYKMYLMLPFNIEANAPKPLTVFCSYNKFFNA